MTLVLALCGSDGYVLAADARITTTPTDVRSVGGSALYSASYGNYTSKILVSERHGVMIGWAGQDVAHEAAELLREHLNSQSVFSFGADDDFGPEIKGACKVASETIPHVNSSHSDGSLLVVNPHSEFRPLWLATFHRHLTRPGQEAEFHCRPLWTEDKQVVGLNANSALYFLERYFSPNRRTMDELVALAAHVILSASRLAKDAIDGIEIATCKRGGMPEFIQFETIREVWARSQSLSKDIETALYAPLSGVVRSQKRTSILLPTVEESK